MTKAPKTESAIRVDEMKVKILNKYLKRYKLETKGSVSEKALRLDAYFREIRGSIEDIVQCETCGGFSDATLPECPYCGDNEPVVYGDAKKKESNDTQKPATEGGNDAAEIDIADQTQIVFTEEDLDLSVDRVNKHARLTALEILKLGRAFKHIHDKQLWKLRTDEHGKQKYLTFKSFCAAELTRSFKYVYMLMHVAENYTEEQIKDFGISKLAIGLQIPREQREKFLEDGRDETQRSLSQRAREMRDELENKDVPKLPPPPPDKSVTVAMIMGAQTLPMWRRPTKPGKVSARTVPAKKLEDSPWTKLQLENNVMLYIRMTRNKNGELEAIVEARRGQDAIESA